MNTPVLNYNNTLNEFYWDAISGADTYFIYANGEIYDSTTETNYSATSIPNGSDIYVTAYNSLAEEESTASNTITFYSSLSAPYIGIGGTTISWNAVSGATQSTLTGGTAGLWELNLIGKKYTNLAIEDIVDLQTSLDKNSEQI